MPLLKFNGPAPVGITEHEYHFFENSVFKRRCQTELEHFNKEDYKNNFEEIKKIDIIPRDNQVFWQLELMPECKAYKNGKFVVNLIFPVNYPFVPPLLIFANKIFHPNVNLDGQVFLDILRHEKWRSQLMASDVIMALLKALEDPEMNNIANRLAGELFSSNFQQFLKIAQENTILFSL